MAGNNKKRYLERIHAIEDEIVHLDEDEKRQNRQSRRRVLIALGVVVFASMITVASLVLTGHLKIFREDTPLVLSLRESTLEDNGDIRILIDVDKYEQAARKMSFTGVRAFLMPMQGERSKETEVIPVYMKDGTIQLLLIFKNLVAPKEPFKWKIRLFSENSKTNSVFVEKLEKVN
jgi:hypothetical protein